MGTNFYDARGRHLGKRSAAGAYCWDCGISLCMPGAEFVHEGREFHACCPECGKERQVETIETGAAGRELGFNKTKPKKKKGVASCSSFTWASRPEAIINTKYIKDEYGRRYSLRQFLAVLEECPIRFYNAIGTDFS